MQNCFSFGHLLCVCFGETVNRNVCGIICRTKCGPWNCHCLCAVVNFGSGEVFNCDLYEANDFCVVTSELGFLLWLQLLISTEENLKITTYESWTLMYWHWQEKREGSHSAGPSPLVNRAWFSDVLWKAAPSCFHWRCFVSRTHGALSPWSKWQRGWLLTVLQWHQTKAVLIIVARCKYYRKEEAKKRV